jgi:CNT family concentrative nucleoside transporter
MRLVSVLGLVALLGVAWALSYHRRSVRLRTVSWGIGLQLLFAVIILRRDAWSWVGMVVLAGLVGTYVIVRATTGRHSTAAVSGVLGVAAVVGSAVVAWAGPAIPVLFLAAVVAMLVVGRWESGSRVRPYLAVLVVALLAAWPISRGLYGEDVFAVFSEKVASFLSLSDYGARFLFGNLADPEYFFPGASSMWPGFGFQFAFKVLPTIVFFGGFMGVLYHLGVMQKVIEAMARFMRWTVGTSGAETLSCSANIFVGQTEAPLLIKPFLNGMTSSELLTVMVGGFATIAGGVLAGYIAMGVPAGHLIAASVMSAPAALVMGKIIFPELQHSATAGDTRLPDVSVGGNVVEAATNGITDGLKLAVNVGAMLLGFIALIAVVDVLLNWVDGIVDGRVLVWLDSVSGGLVSRLEPAVGTRVTYGAGGMSPAVAEYVGFFPGSLQTLFGTVLRPLAFLMGVPWEDAGRVGNLLGIKLSLNEFVAYGTLGDYLARNALGDRATIIATYALCGFANFSSIGIQIGGIAALAPERRSELAKLGLRAMFGGALASWMTATIAGMLL